MSPTDPQHPWQRLTAAARRAPADRDPVAPYGFATRIAAMGLAQEPAPSLFASFSLRALAVACLLMVGSVAANYSLITTSTTTDDEAAVTLPDDPVAEVVAIAS